MRRLQETMKRSSIVRFLDHFAQLYPESHMKDLVVDELGPERELSVNGHRVINFGSDSFLGLDQDPRVREALERGVRAWGTHNGASRAFASVRANAQAEERLAKWLGTEAVLIYPSVTLANLGAIPALMARNDVLVVDSLAHNSIQEGAKLASANGAKVSSFASSDPIALGQALRDAGPARASMVAVDGVFSMSGTLAPLLELNEVALEQGAVLYVDDAHGTGTLGTKGARNGPGCARRLREHDRRRLAVQGVSCFGGFIGCSAELKELLKKKSSTFIFGGPVPPPYLEAVLTALDILDSNEYDLIHARLASNVRRIVGGMNELGLAVLGGLQPILSVLVGDEGETLAAGRFLFDRGFYVQSVVFPAVPYHAGVLRVQANANHSVEAIDGLLAALADLRSVIPCPGPKP